MRKRLSGTEKGKGKGSKRKSKRTKSLFSTPDLSKVLSFNPLGDVVLDMDALHGLSLILKAENAVDGISLRWKKESAVLDLCSTGICIVSVLPVACNRVEFQLVPPDKAFRVLKDV